MAYNNSIIFFCQVRQNLKYPVIFRLFLFNTIQSHKMANKEQILEEIESVDWRNYETAYGKADNIPRHLRDLILGDAELSLNACHELWCSLCHQHAYISSAAEPAYPFLRYALKNSNKKLAIELLDLFAGFSVCSSFHNPQGYNEFQARIRGLLITDIALFEKYAETESSNGHAQYILEQLRNNK